MNKIFNGDCFDIFPKIENRSVDLVMVDLPYGQTAFKWDVKIDLAKLWVELRRIAKDKCNFIFFTTTRFGIDLINSKPKWFCYDLVWKKSNSVGFLNSNKMPLRNHEMIYLFNSGGENDIENCRNLEMRSYSKRTLEFIGKTPSQINRELGNFKAVHFFSHSTSQFSLPTKETYSRLIELFKINKMEGFLNFEELKPLEKSKELRTYNPQKTEGKPYKVKGHKLKKQDAYGNNDIKEHYNETGERQPTSVVNFNTPNVSLHGTQKPLDLCEWLIKTYSNENDLVLDFCMGSGTTIVACKNTNRNYIGIEKDNEIFKVAEERINNMP
jgi:site-specific DNA-methyltransferase (adenine-specific)